MPQLVKGGKWVYGWVIVGSQADLMIPPEAWDEFGFQPGEEAVFVPGSRTSGGFGLSTARLLAHIARPMQMRELARSHFGENGQVEIPSAVGVLPGDRLLAVRGSSRALGFVARCPICEEAEKHGELGAFESQSPR